MLQIVLFLAIFVDIINSQKVAGCANSTRQNHELVPGKISACSGSFSGGMFDKSTTSLCALGYKLCHNQTQVASMGLTKEVCGFEGSDDPNMLYLGQIGGIGWDCEIAGVNDIQSVFGCGGGTYIHAATQCGVLADVGSSGEQIGFPDDMGVTDDTDNLHTVYNDGNEKCGVLCCKSE